MILVGILVFLAVVSFQSQLGVEASGDPGAVLPEANMIGTVGHYTAQLLMFLFGKSAFLLGPYLFLLGFLTFYRGGFTDPLSRVVAVLVVMAGTSLLGALLYQVDGRPSESAGGLLGAQVGQAFQVLFGTYGGFILAMGIFLTGVFLAIRIPVPVFLGQLNHRLVAAIRAYSRALSGEGQIGYREAYAMAGGPSAESGNAGEGDPAVDAAPPTGAEQPDMMAGLVHKEAGTAGERRPWIERVAVAPENEEYGAAGDPHAFAQEDGESDSESDGEAPLSDSVSTADGDDILYNDFPEMDEADGMPDGATRIRGLQQRTRLSGNARHLQAALSRIESRPGRSDWLNDSPGRQLAAAAGAGLELSRASAGEGGDLSGFFNEDETRFHFRAAPVSRQSKATRRGPAFAEAATAGSHVGFARTPAFEAEPVAPSRDPHTEFRATTGDILEPLDLQLLQHRERRNDRGHSSHALNDLPTPPAVMDEFESDAVTEADLQNAGVTQISAGEVEPTSNVAAPIAAAEPDRAEVDERVALDPIPDAAENFEAGHIEDDVENEDVLDMPDTVDATGVGEAGLEADDASEVAEVAAPAGVNATDSSVSAPLLEAAPAPARKPRKKPVPLSAVPKFQAKSATRRYHLPGNLLKPGDVPPREDVSREIDVTRERLEKVMQDYGIQARVVRTQRGPIITLYEVKLEAGVRVSRILGISDEIKMNLEAPSIRIIAPIPGKPTVGIEIPNRHREGVVLGDMLDRDVMARNELCVVLGKNIAGEKQYVDLARLPHLLIAGSTGSGKSVYMNAIIASLLYTRSPEDVRFIMIDPKMVELKLFEGIPHLIMPVITDVRQASKALTWVINEMERRYEILSHSKSRDIRSFNDRIAAETQLPGFPPPEGAAGKREKMPYIVVFIDELSDLMMVAAKDVEDSIIRLTQKARAVGIHIVMATQRPSVDVITALIKANCPARIAFHVAQKTDSRTILDMNGAETLLGKGDMLYRSPSSTALVRLQAPLLTEAEIENVVQETARYGEPAYVDLEAYIEEENTEAAENDVDSELLQQAWKIVLESGKTSTSYIQRRLRIGYNRAASLIEMLEQKGYLSPAIGNKPREILKRS